MLLTRNFYIICSVHQATPQKSQLNTACLKTLFFPVPFFEYIDLFVHGGMYRVRSFYFRMGRAFALSSPIFPTQIDLFEIGSHAPIHFKFISISRSCAYDI